MTAETFFRIVAVVLMAITARVFWREYGAQHYKRYTQAQDALDRSYAR